MPEISEAAKEAAKQIFSVERACYVNCTSIISRTRCKSGDDYLCHHEASVIQSAIDAETADLRRRLAEAKSREEKLQEALKEIEVIIGEQVDEKLRGERQKYNWHGMMTAVNSVCLSAISATEGGE